MTRTPISSVEEFNASPNQLFTAMDVSRITGTPYAVIREAIKSGTVATVLFGATRAIRRSTVEHLLAEKAKVAPTTPKNSVIAIDFYETDREAFTIDETAAILGIDRRKVTLAVENGHIAASQIGSRKFVHRSALEALLNEAEPAKDEERQLDFR